MQISIKRLFCKHSGFAIGYGGNLKSASNTCNNGPPWQRSDIL